MKARRRKQFIRAISNWVANKFMHEATRLLWNLYFWVPMLNMRVLYANREQNGWLLGLEIIAATFACRAIFQKTSAYNRPHSDFYTSGKSRLVKLRGCGFGSERLCWVTERHRNNIWTGSLYTFIPLLLMQLSRSRGSESNDRYFRQTTPQKEIMRRFSSVNFLHLNWQTH